MTRATILALLLAPAAAAAQGPAAAPAAPKVTEPAAPPASTPVPATVAEAPATAKGFSLDAGFGYYEVAHLGVAYHPSDRSAVALFGGYGLGRSDQDGTLGLSYSHALFGPIRTLQPGWKVKAIYWSQSDELYDWKNLSTVLGAYVAKDLGRGLRLALDGGVAWTFALDSDRTQDFTFGHPTRWNGSLCLEISWRLGAR